VASCFIVLGTEERSRQKGIERECQYERTQSSPDNEFKSFLLFL
jgi:hypothetical protein